MNKMILSLVTIVSCFSFASTKEPIAVMDLKAKGVNTATASILSDELRTVLFKAGDYNVLNREDMKAILGEHAFQQSGACDDTRCMAKVGGALGVVFMVTGSIGKLGDTYSITLKMIDIETIENVNIVDEKYRGAEEGLFQAISNAGRKLLNLNISQSIEVAAPVVQKKKVKRAVLKPTAYIDISKGTMTDPRDGQTYKIVKIGDRVWMGENLNYETSESWCYQNNSQYGLKYGRYYSRKAAKEVCPAGWHLPTKKDLVDLITKAGRVFKGGAALKEGGRLHFDALLVGYRAKKGKFYDFGKKAYFWTQSKLKPAFKITKDRPNVYYPEISGANGLCVRCVRNQ